MTSITKLLVAAAAVSALSVAACSKPAENTTTNVVENTTVTEVVPADANASGPIEIGSLIGYATKQQAPVYPPAAKTTRTTGVVRVDIVVNEKGEVAEVQKASGPSMLQSAARDAIKRWKFRPFTRDGQPVKANGYVSFNFNL